MKGTHSLLVVLALTPMPLLTLGGCGADATVPFKGDGGSGVDSGNAGDGGTASDSGTTIPPKGGGIYLMSYAYALANTKVAGMSASAGFYSSSGSGGGSCTTTTDGPCTVSVCATSGVDAGGSAVAASAGVIDVTGGSQAVLLVPSGTTYAATTAQATLWSGGEQLEAIGAGAEVPAFDLKVTAPGYVTVISPSWPAAGGKIPITRAQPFDVAWSGGGAGNVLVGITGLVGSQSTSLSCSFAAAAGAGSVPASALGKLPASPTSASVSITASNSTEEIVSGWLLRVSALTLAKSSTGLASAAATIQ